MVRIILVLLLFWFVVPCHSQKAEQPKTEVFSEVSFKKIRLYTAKTFKLDARIPEGSGLTAWNSRLWAHNDSGNATLFSLDTLTGKITSEYDLAGIKNNDWEDISQDNNYFYIGGFGNNTHKRDTLKIYRISKASLLQKKPDIDSISFTWPSLISHGRKQKINFDCEAIAVINDSIYLFTKEWKTHHCTKVFSLPAQPGNQMARYKTTLNTRVLVTGASYDQHTRKLILCGYNIVARPCLLVFDDVDGNNLFPSNGLKAIIKKLPFHQVEGIATFDGNTYYIINEDFRLLFIHNEQELHRLKIDD